MPPILPNKDKSSRDYPSKRGLLEALDAPPRAASAEEIKNSTLGVGSDSFSSDSSLSEIETPGNGETHADSNDDDDDVNWEDAIADTTTQSGLTTAPAPILRDLDITLEKNEDAFTNALSSKKGPTKIERLIRTQTHCMHVQCLLFHNAIRNSWINDSEIHQILRDQLPEGIKKEIQRWKVAAGLEKRESRPSTKRKGKSRQRDWGNDSAHVEPNEPDLSGGDPTIHILKVLAAYWRKRFKINAPGLRKRGYRPIPVLEKEINSFNKQDEDSNEHGESIASLIDFRGLARNSNGSRDAGAQLFTALLRALGIEARMVANLQPIGFGWTKAEDYAIIEKDKKDEHESETESPSTSESERPAGKQKGKAPKKIERKIDEDLLFPVYWTEAVSPTTNEIIPVETLILRNPVATTPELLAAFEPRGAKAERAKQVIAYVVAYSPDATAKDVTIRYLKRQTWPGKTKGFRIPTEKVSFDMSFDPEAFYVYDWFKNTMRSYIRPHNKRTAVDEKEDNESLVPRQAERKASKGGDTLQSLRTSTEFVLERFLRREEAIPPGVSHVRMFVTGKGDKRKEEKVFQRPDVEKCLSAESWRKEGRKVKVGEVPLKLVPIRAVTLNRKREVDELHRETGEKPKQGLYARRQTEYIVPPPIKDGKIPKNEYGNMDCFVPSMVPRGAVHIPWPGTVRVCRKLGVDCAEAVTGFEFGSKMAVPVIEGVVVAAENEDLVKDAWRADEAEKRKKEQLKKDKLILSTWRKFIMGLRITERLQEEYGDPAETEPPSQYTNQRAPPPFSSPIGHNDSEIHESGGGFLVPGDNEIHDDGFAADQNEQFREGNQLATPMDIDDEASSEISDVPSAISISS